MKRKNLPTCRTLRKNQTDAEKKLWSILRSRKLAGAKFRRQCPLGKYILDFYCPELKLCIEADGGQHYEDTGRQQDALRTQFLSGSGVQVLRFSNLEILNNIEGVLEVIRESIESKRARPPSPQSSPRRGEEI
jgi:very-short-patch-repair endonuclease